VAGVAPAITSTAVTAGTVNQAYSYDVDATGIPAPTYALTVSPAGMTIDAATGVIQWFPEPNQIGDVNIIVEANNTAGFDHQIFSITVLLSDNFDDNKRGAMWRLFAEDCNNAWLIEDSNQLELRAASHVNDLVAFYVANDWSFDVNEDFAVEVDFHYGGISDQNGWIGMIVENDNSCVSISAGSDSNESYFYYEAFVDGNIVFEQELRDTNDGTLYISYDTDSNHLYLSHVGYGSENAYIWQTTSAPLLQGQSVAGVIVIIGGGSQGVAMGTGEAYLDNFEITTATLLDWPPITDLNGDGFITWSDFGIMSENWLETGQGDFNNDGIVDFLDYADFAWVW
jgi:hypothetical protein